MNPNKPFYYSNLFEKMYPNLEELTKNYPALAQQTALTQHLQAAGQQANQFNSHHPMLNYYAPYFLPVFNALEVQQRLNKLCSLTTKTSNLMETNSITSSLSPSSLSSSNNSVNSLLSSSTNSNQINSPLNNLNISSSSIDHKSTISN